MNLSKREGQVGVVEVVYRGEVLQGQVEVALEGVVMEVDSVAEELGRGVRAV
jgi:hypothetical protein